MWFCLFSHVHCASTLNLPFTSYLILNVSFIKALPVYLKKFGIVQIVKTTEALNRKYDI